MRFSTVRSIHVFMTDILLLYFFSFALLSLPIFCDRAFFLSNVIIVRYTYSHVLPSKNRGPTNGSSKYNVQQHFRLIINAVLFARHDMTTGASNMKFLNPNYAMDDVLCYDITYVQSTWSWETPNLWFVLLLAMLFVLSLTFK